MNFLNKLFGWDDIKSSHRLMLLIVLLLGLLNFFWGEKVTAGGGFGWDGVTYAEMVRHLDTMISNSELGSYYMQRILPAAIVRGLLLLADVSINNVNIINGFEIYNLFILVLILASWKRISDKLLISIGGRWIGFSAIFINFECSKQSFFYPVLTDVTALLVGMLLLLFYIEKKPILLLIVSIVGAFCWPVVSLSGALLIFLLKTVLPDDVIKPQPLNLTFKPFIFLLSASVLCYLVLMLFTPVSEQVCNGFNQSINEYQKFIPTQLINRIENSINGVDSCLIGKALSKFEKLLTATPSIFVLFMALVTLIGSTSFFKYLIFNIWKTQILLILIAVAALSIPALIVKYLSNPSVSNPSSLINLVLVMLFPQEGKFFLALVSLSVFWGPVVLLIIIYWNEFCVQARKLGPGLVAVIALTLILGFVGEPRFLTIGWPFFVLVLVLVFEELRLKPAFKPVFIIITIIFAQFWIRLNYEPWSQNDFDGLQDFPKQFYFMHYGLWMSWLTYLLQFIIVIISAYVLKSNIINPIKKIDIH